MKEIQIKLMYGSGKEEGYKRPTRFFNAEHPVIQLDILGDWIYDLEELYEKIRKEFYRPEKSSEVTS